MLKDKLAAQEYGRKWRAANQDRVRANRKRYSAENRAAIARKTREWYKKNVARQAAYNKRYGEKHAVRIKRRRAEYHVKNRYHVANHWLLRKYGMTLEQRDALLANQEGKCAVCRTTTPGGKGWVVDHDHVTGKVRGILCLTCNTGIGHLKDDVNVLKAAVVYLERT